MAQNTKEYLVKTVYDNAGLERFKQDAESAKVVAKQFGAALSDAAHVIDQSVTTSINKAGNEVRRVTSIISDSGKNTRVVFDDVKGSVKGVSSSFQSFGTVAGSLGAEFSKLAGRAILVVPIWELLRFGLKSLEDTFINSIKFMVEWEDQMAHIRAVTGASTSDIASVSQALLAMSATFGISNKDLAESANLWLRNGASIQTVIPLVEATAKLSLLSGKSLEDASQGLAAIMAGFALSANGASLAVDKLAAVEEKSGISIDVLSSAMAKSASTATAAGVSFDELAGFIAAINDKTKQSGDLIGSELRSIFLRLGTTAIDTAQAVSKVPFFLDALGNATTEHTPQLRNLNTIITELSLSFNKLSNAQQDQLSKAVGGNLRANAVNALFSNFDVSIKAQAESAFGLKDASKAIEDLTGTAKNHILQLQGAWGQFVDSFQQTGLIKGSLEILKGSLEGISAVINPDNFSFGKVIEGVSKIQEESGKKLNQNVNLLSFIDRLHEMNQIFAKDIPGSIEHSVALAANFRKVFEDAGIHIQGTFKDTFDLEKILGAQKNDFLTNAVDASLTSKRADIENTFVKNSKQLADVIKNNTNTGLGITPTDLHIEGIVERLVNLQKLTGSDVDFIKTHIIPGLSIEQGQAVNKLLDTILSKEQNLKSVDQERASIIDEITSNQKKASVATLTQEEIQNALKDIEEKGLLLNQDKLVTIQAELDFLEKNNIAGNKALQTEEDLLIKKKNTLLVQRELLDINLAQAEIIAKLKAEGASQLQIDIQHLANLKAQKDVDPDLIKKAQSAVNTEVINQQKSLQDSLITSVLETAKAHGASQSQILSEEIALEDQLGIHKQGIDLLKQQLGLYKAITDEAKKTKEQRLNDLQDLIKKTPSAFSSAGIGSDLRSSIRENSLRLQASARGISDTDVNRILNPQAANGGQNSLIDQLQRGLTDPLGTNITHLAESIQELTQQIIEPQKAPLSTIIPTFKSPGQEDVLTTTSQRRTATTGPGGTPNGGNHTTVDIGGIQVTVQGNSPEEIAKEIGKVTEELVAAQLVKPGTKANKATKKVIEEF